MCYVLCVVYVFAVFSPFSLLWEKSRQKERQKAEGANKKNAVSDDEWQKPLPCVWSLSRLWWNLCTKNSASLPPPSAATISAALTIPVVCRVQCKAIQFWKTTSQTCVNRKHNIRERSMVHPHTFSVCFYFYRKTRFIINKFVLVCVFLCFIFSLSFFPKQRMWIQEDE